MRNKQLYVRTFETIARQNILRDLCHLAHCIFEDGLALLVDKMHPLIHRFMGCRIEAAASGHVKGAAARTIHLVDEINDVEFGGKLKGPIKRWKYDSKSAEINRL